MRIERHLTCNEAASSRALARSCSYLWQVALMVFSASSAFLIPRRSSSLRLIVRRWISSWYSSRCWNSSSESFFSSWTFKGLNKVHCYVRSRDRGNAITYGAHRSFTPDLFSMLAVLCNSAIHQNISSV